MWPSNKKSILLKEMIVRDVIARYKGALLGVLWLFVIPALTLLLYSVLFTFVFKAKWLGFSGDFYVMLFSGLVFFGLISEVLTRSVSIVVSNASYVKKVVFPLELLPGMVVGTALVNFMASFLMLIIFSLYSGVLDWKGGVAILVLIPYVFFSYGIGLFVSAVGAYYKDLAQFTNFIVMFLMYSSPVFYPSKSIPDKYQWILAMNPMTLPLELFREAFFFGRIEWASYFIFILVSLVMLLLGIFVFSRVKKGFVDAI